MQLEEAVEQPRGQALAGCADGHHHLMQLGCVDIRVMQQGPICCLAFLQRSWTVNQQLSVAGPLQAVRYDQLTSVVGLLVRT